MSERRFRRMFRDLVNAFGFAIELRATEIRTGITLIESVAADKFQMELMLVTRNEEERAELREMAIELGKLGVRLDELEPAMRMWHKSKWEATSDR